MKVTVDKARVVVEDIQSKDGVDNVEMVRLLATLGEGIVQNVMVEELEGREVRIGFTVANPYLRASMVAKLIIGYAEQYEEGL